MFFPIDLINSVADFMDVLDDIKVEFMPHFSKAERAEFVAQRKETEQEYRSNWVPPVPLAENGNAARLRIVRMKQKISYFIGVALSMGRMDMVEELGRIEAGLEDAELMCSVVTFNPPMPSLKVEYARPQPQAIEFNMVA